MLDTFSPPPAAPGARRQFCLALAGLLAATALQAQPAPAYEPRRGQPGKDVMWIASPDVVVDRMLQMAEVKAADRLVDLGSGDGKIAIAAARQNGARATGLEYNPKLVQLSIERAQQAGVADKVSFYEADIFVADFSYASVVTMYLLPELNLRLRPLLFAMKPGTRVVSHSWRMGDWQPDETARVGTAEVFLWRVPANASGSWQVTKAPRGGPTALDFTQRFQQVEGTARFALPPQPAASGMAQVRDIQAGVTGARLQGEALSFGVRDAAGAVLQVQARVRGDTLQGTLTRAGGRAQAFEAVRSGAAPALPGLAASEQEQIGAVRTLNPN